MKSLARRDAGNDLAASGEQSRDSADRVQPLHPLQHLVAAALGRDVQVLAQTFGRSRTA